MVDFQERDTRFDGTDADGATADAGADETGDEGESDQGTAGGHDEPDQGHDDGHHSHDDHDTHGHDDAHAGRDHHAHDVSEVGVAVVTVSTSRSLEEDPSGDAIVSAAEAAGHTIVTRELVGDSLDGVQSIVDALVDRQDVDAVVTTGGTGVSPDDVTVEAVRPLFEKDLPGFGETFRRLSFEEVGTRVVGTRAVAGIADGVPVFALPGSENAVRLGIEAVILPELGHLAGLATRGMDDDEE
ncbi:MAG: molybdenum cofactor biosynthesis protein B [Halanaeroarchaeum sp.]